MKKTTKKRIAKPKVVKQVDEPFYTVSLTMNGETMTCETTNIAAALELVAPKVFKTKVVIKVSNQFSSVERVMMIARAKMIFRNPLAMNLFVKNVLLALKHV